MNEGPIERVRLLLARSSAALATGDVAAELMITRASARRALARLVKAGEASAEGGSTRGRRYRRAELHHVEPVAALAQRALAALSLAPRTLAELAAELGAPLTRTRGALVVLKRQGAAAPERRGASPRWNVTGPRGESANPAGPSVGKVTT